MSNIIDSIQLSGTVYTIQGSGGGSVNPTVELTQAEYDALVSAGTVSANTYYIITDASEVNPNDYVKKADNVVSGYSTYKLFSGVTSGYPSKLTDEVLYRKYNFSNNTDSCNFYFKADESSSTYGYYAEVGLNWQSKSADTYDYQVSVEWSDSLDGFLIKSTNTSYPYFSTFTNSNNYRDSGRLYYKDGEIQSGQTAAYLNSIHKGVDANYVVGFPDSTSISNSGYINIRLLTESGDISTSIKIANTDDFNWDNNGISYKKVEGEYYYDTLAMTTYGSCRIPSSEKTSYPDAYTGIKLKINPSYNTENTDRSISIYLGGTTNKTNNYWNITSTKTIYYNASTDSIDTNNIVGTYGIESITYDQTSHYITILMDVSNTYDGYYWAIKQIGHGSCWIGTNYQIIEAQAQTNKYKPFDYLNVVKQDKLSAGTGISIVDNVISATGGGGGGMSSGEVQTMIDESISGKVDTSAITSSVTSASTDSEIPTAKAVYDAIPTGGTGGSKAISAGTNISVTTGETADTINCTLNAKNGTGNSSFIANGLIGGIINKAAGECATTFGLSNKANGRASFVIGGSNTGGGEYSFVGGSNSEARGNESFAFGYGAKSIGQYSIAFGSYFPLANNTAEVAIGKANVSHTGSTDADKTLFSVGNGTNSSNRHNAFEIRQNGDMYLNNGTSDIKLQDYLQIKVVKLTQSAYDALSPNYDSNTLYIIKD